MKTFNYSAVDADGVPQSGSLKASNRRQAEDALRKRSFIVTKLKEESAASTTVFLRRLLGVPMRDKIIFTRQLGTMIGSGLPINQALRILSDQTTNQYFSGIIVEIGQQIDGGSSLHDAMANYEKEFGRLYLALIKAGETSGNLDVILTRLADSLEADEKFKTRVRGAMIYPVIIVIVMILVLLIMFVFVIPRLSELYEDLDAELPFMTQLLISVSGILTRYIWLVILGVLGLIWGFKRLMKQREFAEKASRLQIKAPIFGILSVEVQMTSFTRTLGMLLSAGISLLDALKISKETFSNVLFQQAVDDASQSVEKGKPLSEGFRKHDVFPTMVSEMMAIGEQTGKTEEILSKLAEYFENQSTSKTDNLASAIEPIVMVLLGVMVGFIVVAMILPIYSLTSQF